MRWQSRRFRASQRRVVPSRSSASGSAGGSPPRTDPAGCGAQVTGVAKPLEERAVLDVLRSGQLSLGPRVPAFEQAFAARVGAPFACAVSSGTAGLHLALRAVGVEDGDEVVTSPFSFVASANAALYERARPVFADIDPVTLNLDPEAADAAVTERTKALLPVHIFGYPADLPAFERIAREAWAGDRRGRLRGARRCVRRRDLRWGGGGILLCSGSMRTSSSRPARGGWSRLVIARAEGADRLRAQPGARPGHGLAGS